MCFLISSTVFLSLPKTSLQTALGRYENSRRCNIRVRLTKEELLNLQNHDELLAEVDRLRLSMKKELDFWTKSTTMGARDWCDRLRQAEQKFREAAEKNARLEEAPRDLNSKLDQLALMTNCARAQRQCLRQTWQLPYDGVANDCNQ